MKEPGERTKHRRIDFASSPGFVEILEQLNVSLLASTYSAGKLAVVGRTNEGLAPAFYNFDRPMGVARKTDRLAVGTRHGVWLLRSDGVPAREIEPKGAYDSCYLTRASVFTSDIQIHELAWDADGRLWGVNTLFSCLCGFDEAHSFTPKWKPRFVTATVAEDRCHLNGLAMRDGRPAFVTAHGATDTAAGWREGKESGGVVVDIESGEVVCAGFCMPHSPRYHNGSLWLLNSGEGAVVKLDPRAGTADVVTVLPGYTRGLAFVGNFAFVGLSLIRETSVFGGMPIAERKKQLHCGVGIVDLTAGRCVATLQFLTGIGEVFDLQIVPGSRPFMSGPHPTEDDTTQIWVVPSG